MHTTTLAQLAKEELARRAQAQEQLKERENLIKQFIQDHCQQDPKASLPRESWQDFCFRKVFNRSCKANTAFVSYLNNLMPKLGFPLGYAHDNLSVYRGLKWKSE